MLCTAFRTAQRYMLNLSEKGTVMPALGGRQPISFSFIDYDGEKESLRLFANEITAVSLPGLLTEIGALRTALEAVTLGNVHKASWGEETIITNARATDKDAQVTTQMLVRAIGNTTEQPFSFRIPTVDPEAFNYIDGNVVLTGDGASAATTALLAALAPFSTPFDETESFTVVQMRIA